MISHNPALTKIARLASLTQLTTLQLIGNTALSTIDGFEGLGDLSTLMVDGPYASDALARCIRLPALRIVQVESRPELREAAAQFQTLRKKHKLPDVDFYFIPNYAHEEKPELGEPLGQGQDDDEPR